MKKINLFIFLFLSLGIFGAKAGNNDTDISKLTNTLYIESLTVDAGSEVTLSLKMKNSNLVVGYQCDIVLPEGMTFQTDEEGFALTSLSTARTTVRKTDYFNTSFPENDLQHLRILCSSSKKYEFSGNDGEVGVIPICIDANMASGAYPITISQIVLTDPVGKTVEVANVQFTITVNGVVDPSKFDLNGDGTVDVGDEIMLREYILQITK